MMEDWNNINSNIFKNLSFMDQSPIVNKYLRFLLIYDEHNALLGATNMGDIVWAGTIWHYNNILDFSREKATATKQIDHGVCNAACIEQNKYVMVGDQGDVEIFEVIKNENELEPPHFESIYQAKQHDDIALTVSVFSNKTNIVTGGMDCCIKVWDIEDLIAMYSYNYAHVQAIASTDVKPMCNSTFVSAAYSGDALLWDIRQPKPAHCIYENDSSLTAIAWEPSSDHIVAIGSADGRLTLIDIRQPSNYPLYESFEGDRGVHKLLFNPNPERKNQLACCFDDTPIKVFDSKEMQVIFEDNVHSDFVQGFAWHKDELFSCSWDGNVMKHTILPNDGQ